MLEWDPIEHATADVISLSLFRNGQKAGNIPRPGVMQSTKISGLAVDTEYTFHLVLRTTAGTFQSEKVTVKTHKMTDLSGITVTPGILPAQLRDSLTKAVERIGAKMADTVRIDTTHFVTTEGRGLAWEKAVEMNIPVVRPEWVEGCERGGRIVGVRQYYLDADPRQRQMGPTPTEQEPAREASVASPPATNGTNGSGAGAADRDVAVPPTPPAKDTPNFDEESSADENDEKSAVPDEQKVRVEDRDQHKVALRPVKPASEADSEEVEKGKEEDETAEEGGLGSGSQTPGHSSFQDVAL